MKLLLWDIDGTLLLTGFAGRDLMHSVGRRLFSPRFSLDAAELGGQVDLALFHHAMEAAGLEPTDEHWLTFRTEFVVALRAALAEARDALRVMPGVVELLADLHRRDDVINGIVTGNFREAAHAKLEAAAIEHRRFRPAAFGCESRDRHELVRLAVERGGTGFSGEDVIVIGDTVRDVACAKANGAFAFGVATGHQSREQLLAAGADVAVENLSDAGPLLALLGSSQVER